MPPRYSPQPRPSAPAPATHHPRIVRARRGSPSRRTGRADVCEAYAVFGPVIVNEVIDTVVGTRDSLSDDDAAALKGVVLEECFR